MGDKVAARKSYNDFLTRRKDDDPDIPIYKHLYRDAADIQSDAWKHNSNQEPRSSLAECTY